jgi:RimJ/RimL family protein N-acetyltransferase
MKVEPVVLTGKHVRLEPLSAAHTPGLAVVGADPSIWQFMPYGDMSAPGKMEEWVREILSRREAGTDQPFTVIHLDSGQVAGATRYMDIRPAHRNLEIGGTWYGAVFRRTPVNTEAKYLLLRHAFETLGAIRVQLKTDARNERSQAAIERIGAKREGVLRNHLILPDGSFRSSVYFSILESEWPTVKARLEGFLAR